MKHILVVAPSWIGDAVLAQPLFKRLHQRHPELALDVVAPSWTLPLFERMPEVRSAISAPFGHGELALGRRYTLGRRLAAQRYEQAIVLPNTFKSALAPFFARIPVRTGLRGEARHGLLNDMRALDEQALPQLAERYALLAEEAGQPPQRPLALPFLSVDGAQRAATLAHLGLALTLPPAILCPGAEFGPAKRWPANYYGRLAQRLRDAGHPVWLVGSPKDRPVGEAIANASGDACVNLCGKTSLSQAIDLLSCAALVVSNDSGLMHVAAALDRPLVAIFGSSSPAYTPPLAPHARIISLNLSCSPCFKRECPLGHFNCMMQLTPERVCNEIGFDTIAG
jgi:heptosyltransferase-2